MSQSECGEDRVNTGVTPSQGSETAKSHNLRSGENTERVPGGPQRYGKTEQSGRTGSDRVEEHACSTHKTDKCDVEFGSDSDRR